jgi:hypothetical protein
MALDPRQVRRSRNLPMIIGAVVILGAVLIYVLSFAGARVDNRAEPPPTQTETPSGSTPGTQPPASQ